MIRFARDVDDQTRRFLQGKDARFHPSRNHNDQINRGRAFFFPQEGIPNLHGTFNDDPPGIPRTPRAPGRRRQGDRRTEEDHHDEPPTTKERRSNLPGSTPRYAETPSRRGHPDPPSRVRPTDFAALSTGFWFQSFSRAPALEVISATKVALELRKPEPAPTSIGLKSSDYVHCSAFRAPVCR
jgi:hypothetical protein